MVFIPSLSAARDCDLMHSRNHTHKNEWKVWGWKWRLTPQNRRTLKSGYLPYPLDLSITGEAGEWVILNSVPKVKAAFPHNGQSLCALRVTSIKLPHGWGKRGWGTAAHSCFCLTTEGRRAQHRLNPPCPFRTLNIQILAEKRCEIPALSWWMLGESGLGLKAFLPICRGHLK